jgi:hypothetical protein
VNTFVKGLIAAVMLATVAAGSANASLLGQDVSASGYYIDIGGHTAIGDGIEFRADFEGLGTLLFDFGASTLTIIKPGSLFAGLQWGGVVSPNITFSGFTDTITSLTLISNDGFDGTILSPSFASNSITLNMEDFSLSSWSGSLVFDIGTSSNNSVPEPVSLTLSALGLAGLAATRRSRKRHTAQ